MNGKKVIGIDLGTTFSEVTHITAAGTVEVAPNLDGDLKTPSVVSYASGKPIVGKAAAPDSLLAPEFVITCGKRQMSEATHDGKPMPISTGPNGEELTAVDSSAAILAYLKESAETYLGCKVDSVAVTVPAYFKEFPRNNTIAAAKIAGFTDVRILDEPVSAAIFYGLEKGRNEKVLVVDFGGGTLDITLVDIAGSNIKALITDGDDEMGGSNYNEAILNFMYQRAGKASGGQAADNDLATRFQNLDKAREAKEMLSRRESTTLVVEIDGQRISVELDRKMLKTIGKEFDDRLLECCERVNRTLTEKGHKVDRIILVGGSSRLPQVAAIVKSVFSIEPSRDTDPDLVVAKGAAIWASLLLADSDKEIVVGGKRYLSSDIKVQRVAAHAICVAACRSKDDPNEYNCPIVPAGTPLPYEFEERFSPLHPDQTEVKIKLVLGKEGDLSINASLLRQITVPIQPSQSNTDRIRVAGKYTEEGLLEITVTDDLLGKPISDSFVHSDGLSDAEIKQKTALMAK